MSGDLRIDYVTRETLAVRVVAKSGTPEVAAHPAWEELEAALPSMRGRRMYGYYEPDRQRYVACVVAADDDPPGLANETLAGGRYARVRLRGAPPELYSRIGPTFHHLSELIETDGSRPWLEFYRREDAVDLLVPVAAA